MFDIRPVGYVIGLMLAVLGAAMLAPMVMDIIDQNGHWPVFAECAILTTLCGALIALACANGVGEGLSIRQTFLLTTGVWVALPIFGALPFWIGASDVPYVDAFFEAMSGLTTTGSTVLSDLEVLPSGLLLWRGLMQWMGGIGVVVMAMVFLPELRVGGMQIFRSEGFDTFGKILPRATQISSQISVIYIGLTAVCALAYGSFGLAPFDAIVHAMTTVSTGGLGNYGNSFADFPPAIEYIATAFMMLAALPFVRYIQLVGGNTRTVFTDSQIRTFFAVLAVVVLLLTLWQMVLNDEWAEQAFRKSLFNATSIMTGTGYSSEDYSTWGPFPATLIFFVGLVGGCAGSTSCSIKVFRFQIVVSSIRAQIQTLHAPSGLFTPRYQGRPVTEDVLNSVMAFFVLFVVSLGCIAVLLGMTGEDFTTSVTGAVAALANIGPGLGDKIGPAGSFADLTDTGKWILSAAMLIGRLELMAVFVLFTVTFWRD